MKKPALKVMSVLLASMLCIHLYIPAVNAMENNSERTLPFSFMLQNQAFSSSMMTQLINDSSLPVAPGVKERRITLLNKEGKRVENFLIEVDLKGSPNTSIVTGTPNDGTGYGMTTVRDQARDANANGKPVVAAVNADFYNMATGEPLGCFVKDGVEVKTLPRNWSFFGIKKDGTPIIGDFAVYQANKGQFKEALGGQCILVKNGEVINYSSSSDTYYTEKQPRTAVGIKADGSVVFMVTDGRQEPYSAGLTMSELGQLMRDLGCIDALNLDGGGSATFVSREQGTDQLACKNKPSDGTERVVANSFLILSNTASDHVFNSAVLYPFDKTYTPNSTVKFTAKGMDKSGASAQVPFSDLEWKLSDGSFGTINPETGEFISSGKQGLAQVLLVRKIPGLINPPNTVGGAVYHEVYNNPAFPVPPDLIVGSTYIEIAVPDAISFRNAEISLEFNELTDLGLEVKYKGRDVILKSGDISWEIPEGMGVMEANIFHTSESGSVSGIITATLVGTSLKTSLDAKVGQLPVVLYDFENGVEDWRAGTAGRGEITSIEAIDYKSGEPVRFGDKSLKLNFDLTKAQQNATLGAYAGPETSKVIPGAPKAIGAWIYATEEAQGYWLRMYIYDKSGKAKPINFTESVPGIDWVGWKYVEAPIPDTFVPPYKTFPNQMIRLMSLKSGAVGPMTKGEIYVDNVRMVYGASVDDMLNPIIHDINVDGKTYNSKAVTIMTKFNDEMSDKYASGMNYERIHMFVDGKDYTNAPGIYALNKGQNVVSLSDLNLPDGLHRVEVVVQDNFGNEARKTAYFTVNTGSGTTVVMDSPDKDGAMVGGKYRINITSNNPSDIKEITAKFKISKDFPIQGVDFATSAAGSTHTYDQKKGIITLNIKNIPAIDNQNTLATINLSIPTNTMMSQNLNYSVEYSDIVYNSDKGQKFASSFYDMPESIDIKAAYNVEIKDALVGRDGVIIVKDKRGALVEGAVVRIIEDAQTTDLGQTDANGVVISPAMTDKVKKIGVYAQKDGMASFVVNYQTLKPFADKKPSNILATAVEGSSYSKNITWMSNPLTSEKAAVMQLALKSDYEKNGENAFIYINGKFEEHCFTGENDINNNGMVRFNSVIAKGLSTDAVYCYRVGDGINWSDIKQFNTTKNGADTNFFVLGDTQTVDMTNLKAVLNSIEASSIDYDFSLHVGDLVDEASKFNQLDAITTTLSTYANSSDTDLILALGNHEYMGDKDGKAARTFFNTPLNGPAENLGACYSTEYGNVYVAVIGFTADIDVLKAQLAWLKTDAAKSKQPWKVLLTHQPVFYSNPEGGNGLFKEMLPKVVDEIGIDFVFSGHDHAYGRTKPLKNGVEDAKGTTYIISGSTGMKYYAAVNDGSFTVFNDEQKPIYITANTTKKANEDIITITALRPDGTVVDTFEVRRDNTPIPPVAENVKFTGKAVVGQTLTAEYMYTDAEAIPEQGTTFRWLISEAGKNNFTAIPNETSKTLLLKKEYVGKEIVVEVTVRNAKAEGIPVTGHNGENRVIDVPDDSGDSDSGSGPVVIPTDNSKVEAFVNGKKQEDVGTIRTTQENDKKAIVLSVDSKKLEAVLEKEDKNSLIIIPVNAKADSVTGEFNADLIKKLEIKEAVVEIRAENASYVIPAEQIKIDEIIKQMGQNVKYEDIKVLVEIKDVDPKLVNNSLNSAGNKEITILGQPTEFIVKCIFDKKTIEVNNFNTYVERRIAIPKDIDIKKVTTGVAIEPDGTLRHVPTQVVLVDGKYYAIINSLTNSIYAVVSHKREFSDVQDHWAKAEIYEMSSKLIVTAANGNFHPDLEITRAEFIEIIVKGLGLRPIKGKSYFKDVSDTDLYAGYINVAFENGIIKGYEDGKFGPNDTITREQAMTIVNVAMNITGLTEKTKVIESDKLLMKYTDSKDISEWAVNSIAACIESGVIYGKSNTIIAPKDQITRAEVAVIVKRILEKSKLI